MPLSPKSILCVEDNDDTRVLLVEMLVQAGYKVLTTATVSSGFRAAKTGIFDLIVIDMNLPDGNGVDLCRQIRALDAKTPIIFFSAEGRESERVKAMESGANEYLIKPYGLEHIVETVNRLIGQANGSAAG